MENFSHGKAVTFQSNWNLGIDSYQYWKLWEVGSIFQAVWHMESNYQEKKKNGILQRGKHLLSSIAEIEI